MKKKSMSRLEKILAISLSVTAMAVSTLGTNYYLDGRPTLVGKCFLSQDRRTGIQFVRAVNGQYDATFYYLTTPSPSQGKVREVNESVKTSLKAGNIVEVNCENEKPIN